MAYRQLDQDPVGEGNSVGRAVDRGGGRADGERKRLESPRPLEGGAAGNASGGGARDSGPVAPGVHRRRAESAGTGGFLSRPPAEWPAHRPAQHCLRREAIPDRLPINLPKSPDCLAQPNMSLPIPADPSEPLPKANRDAGVFAATDSSELKQ